MRHVRRVAIAVAILVTALMILSGPLARDTPRPPTSPSDSVLPPS